MKYRKLKKAFKDRWLRALRSGAYEQTKGRLVTEDDQFCCLGVACDLVANKTGEWVEKEYLTSTGWLFVDYDTTTCDYQCDATLTIGVEEAIFKNEKPGENDPTPILMRKNDKGQSFKVIADWIEKNL